MAQPLTLSNAPLDHPGMDYAFLRAEGIRSIETLAGTRWTDYNTHDPGITILEALCYAITDLSYRLNFEMADLLASPTRSPDSPPLFLTAREILTVNPLTINDYRKLLIDIDGIKNAWLEPIDIPQPELYYDANNAKLTFSSLELAEPVPLRGLYRVLIEKDLGYQDADLIHQATTRLNQHRNLCEDFAEIRVLPIEEITIRAEIEIAEHINPHQLMAQLHNALDRAISPTLEFASLAELLHQGVPVEEIFAGPILTHGFIDDQHLHQFGRKAELHSSDLIQVMLDLPGIKTVRTMTLASSQSPTPEAWALDLDTQFTPRLKSISAILAAGDITCYKGQIQCQLDQVKVEAAQADLWLPHNPLTVAEIPPDLPIPPGEDRDLSDYESIQSEFPLAYGIGAIGLPPSASAERQAQAKQLQAYLMVFDQLLANYFAQLDQVKTLFSADYPQTRTYFTQSIAHFPGGSAIFKETYEARLEALAESGAVALERRNRFLEHLIAQYGETFTDYSLLYPNTNLSADVIRHKMDFALDYRAISSGRNQAFNYTLDPNDLANVHNVSGLQRRLARLLGLQPERQFLASSHTEGFYIVEHLLLRPRQRNASETGSETTADFLSFSQTITTFSASTTPGRLTCTAAHHGLQPGDALTIFYSSYYSGTYVVMAAQADTFEVEHEFVAPDTGEWVSSQQHPDPFSFQMSVVLPSWPERFRSVSVQQLIYDTLVAETPAHITLYLHWLEPDKMREFETIYAFWLQSLSGNVVDSDEAGASSTRLINFLKLGSSEIPDFPALIGYMVIGDSFVVA